MSVATFTSTMSGASSDYMKSLFSNPVKTSVIQEADLLDFSLAVGVPGFVKLKRGAYIDLDSNLYPHWYTGFVTNDPQLAYLGAKDGVPYWGYTYQASGDEYLLSLKPLGLVRPFMNVHMGTILKRMVAVLAPGLYDVSGIQDGPLVAQYTIDPTKKFIDLSKDLCSASNYVFFGKSMKLYFMPQDDVSFPAITLDGSNKHFTPSRLQLKPSASTIINDATVLGDIEPQKYMTEYFIGTGLQGTFPLATSVFGVDTSVLIQDDMTGDALDSSIWDSNDTGSPTQIVSGGYLNIEGGSAYVQSLYPIPLEGNLRLTHGEWDFLSGSGIIGALYKQTPTSGATGCVYGLDISGSTIRPVVNGSVDISQSFTIDTSKRYILRTLAEFSKMHRLAQPYSYVDAMGAVQSVGGTTSGCLANWHTIITEIDPATGVMTKQGFFINDKVALGGDAVFSVYVPVLSAGLHATVSGITISIPVNATLSIATEAPFKNANFDDWASDWVPNGWDSSGNVQKEGTYQDGGVGFACKMYTYPPEPTNPVFLQQAAAGYILPNVEYDVTIRVRRNPSLTAGTLYVRLTGTNADGSLLEGDPSVPGIMLDMSTVGDSFQTVQGVLTTGLNVIPPDLNLIIELLNGSVDQYGGMWVDNMDVSTPFYAKLLGPNEIDSMDGLAPYATITSSNSGAPTRDPLFGTSQFNAGQSQLVFFKDSINRTSSTPTANQIVRLSYRSAGSAIGRVVSTESISSEASLWGDDGHRSVIRQDLTPRPRNSYECELAAYAIVAENMYQHYEGTYTQFSSYFDNEPRAGAMFKLINIPTVASSFAAEQITNVKTTFECDRFSPNDLFSHVVTFAIPTTQLQKILASIGTSVEYQKNNNTITNPEPTDLSLVGLNYADDVTQPRLLSWGPNALNFDVGLTSAPVEVRGTDMNWGNGPAKNLVTTTGDLFTYYFALPDSGRTKTLYMKQVP